MSALITALTFVLFLLSNLVDNFKIIIFILILLNLVIELNFIKFAIKYYKKENLVIYLLGIYAINFSIMFGALLGIFRLFSLKKLKIYFNNKNEK